MPTPFVPVKTSEAVQELQSRQRKLSQRHRTVLLLVDGRRPEDEVRQLAQAAGSPDTCYDELVDLGMISRPAPLDSAPMPLEAVDVEVDVADPVAAATAQHMASDAAPVADSVISSFLPAAASLQPESHLDSSLNELSGVSGAAMDAIEAERQSGGVQDEALEEARDILLRAVKAEAPVAGSLTMLRLRRARTREDLEALLEEVEGRIFKPFKGLWASQTMARVRELLATQPPLSIPSS
ncbi:hypothetical protein [Piscinibacter gummiphilus]|uniref:Uncharacterized protein n=1 Tax=Piscinibacter gummiphilus TaxID=946333 RepID=A0ABZ0CVM4_9BURK|nr:hypothetical protein [Piscinibacter gummiphilus]WOB09037.1 hypothetical protein RXV79_03030 [Piscinibacter gummiphilus]